MVEDVDGDGALGDSLGLSWTAGLSKGMNESRDKQRTVRTTIPAFKLSEERKKERVIGNYSAMRGYLRKQEFRLLGHVVAS